MNYDIFCCECGAWDGTTTCEVTATSPSMCESCHDEYLDEVASESDILRPEEERR
jgi:hypothetical protein